MNLKRSWIEKAAKLALSTALVAGLASCTGNYVASDSSEMLSVETNVLKSSSSTSSDKSGVMLQGFNWSSASSSKDWYRTMLAKSGDIKDNFAYVWFPPPSMSASNEGYLPTQLNNLNSNYGSETELKNVIASIKPAKAIADIVINHRCGTTDWGDFTNPKWNADFYSICRDDEGFSGSAKMSASGNRGNYDTGEGYSAGRDIDHTNYDVQNGIVSWMNNVLKKAGFVGWRYDFVKGYSGYYVGKYNSETNAEFSVGEYWPSAGFSPNNSYAWSSEIMNWINSTSNGGYKTRAFDFVLKGNLNYAFGYKGNEWCWDMTRLADSNNIFRRDPSHAVTFVDNHDTGSTQGHWPMDEGDIGPAYAFILTHPGYPCVAWQHYFTGNGSQYIGGKNVSGTSNTTKQHIDKLISLRKENGICYDSAIQVLYSSTNLYAAKITGTKGNLIVKIGGQNYNPSDSSYKVVYSGTNFCVWSNLGGGSGTGSGTGSGSGGEITTTKVTLSAKYNVGMNNAIYFTGTFDEGKTWSNAVRGKWTSGNVWTVTVNAPSSGNFEWKVLKGSYNKGATTSTSGLTWESGSNHNQNTKYITPSF